MPGTAFHLFQCFGIELEYMIVAADTLSVLPITDRLFHKVLGQYRSDVERGAVTWSNELALHVLELKTTDPATSWPVLAERFAAEVADINTLLADCHARLMPTAMHPWMDPRREMRLWPHESNAIYAAFDRIFDCRGHGWANLQSVHLNLPFAGDDEFGLLHESVRLLLPILPALAASSPVVEGHVTGACDRRLEAYRENARRLPQVSGQVVPESVASPAEYHQQILQPLYEAIAPLDPEGILQHEWLNARGAIARFERSTIEIRVLDVQECPAADLAICWLVVTVLRRLTETLARSVGQRPHFSTASLAALLRRTTRDADRTELHWPAYVQLWGLQRPAIRAAELWQHLATAALRDGGSELPAVMREAIETLIQEGPLARRILRALEAFPPAEHPAALGEIYRRLCDCLATNTMFHAL